MVWSVNTGSVIGLILFGVGILGLIFQVILKQIRAVQLKKQAAEERRNNIQVRETYRGIENHRADTNEILDPYLMFKYMYPQTRKRKKRTARKSKDYAAYVNAMSKSIDETDKSDYKLAYEDMYGDSKNKDDTEDNQYSDIEYFAQAVERVKKYNREHPQSNQNKVDIQTITVKYGNGRTAQSGLYSVSTKK